MRYVNTKVQEKQKNVGGRPPINGKTAARHWHMRVTDEFVAGIDDWRRNQPDNPNRTEALRRLVDLGRRAS
jgi:hypothetical protein